jgi:glutathione S-transferase
MEPARLYGAEYSVYARIARLVLEEAGLPYDLVEVDVFSDHGLPTEYLARQPFGKIPAFEHDGFRLFETDAIAQYVIGMSDRRDLMPEETRGRARATQIMRIMDNYGYPSLVWCVFVEEVERDRRGLLNEDEINRARNVLAVLADLMGRPFLVGERVTLADLWAAPMIAYLRLAPTGGALLGEFPALESWWGHMATRPSIVATRYPAEIKAAGKKAGAG